MTLSDNSFGAPETRLVGAEMELGMCLPEALRERLRFRNGGDVYTDASYDAEENEWTLLPAWDPTDRRSARKTANHIVAANRDVDLGPGNRQALIIGDNGTGDLLLIEAGRTFWWDHETRLKHPTSVTWR